MRNIKYSLMMALAAFIWGTTFVAQRLGAESIDGFSFNSIRSFIGSLALAAVAATLGRRGAAAQLATPAARRDLLAGGLLCGIGLTVPALLQQIGLEQTTAGKAGFITSLYIIIVPVVGLLLGRRVSRIIFCSVAMALVGTYLLCIREGFKIGRGDMMVLGCAFAFAVHIYLIDHFSKKVDGICLSAAQFLFCGFFSLVPLAWTGAGLPAARDIAACLMPLLYAAIFSSGIAYTLQIVAQSRLEPSVASLIMSLESVFAVISGSLFLGERMTQRELAGCALVFAAVILAQLPPGKVDYER